MDIHKLCHMGWCLTVRVMNPGGMVKHKTPRERIHRVAISCPRLLPAHDALVTNLRATDRLHETNTHGRSSCAECGALLISAHLTAQLTHIEFHVSAIFNFVLSYRSVDPVRKQIEFRSVCSPTVSSLHQSFAFTNYLRGGMSLESLI